MDTRIIFSIVSLLFINFSLVQAQPAIFDITKFGAAPDGKADASQAIADAWKEACAAAGSSKILIPAGKFLAGRSSGNRASPPELVGGDGWFNFNHIDQFTLSGKGTLDGQGQVAWKGVLIGEISAYFGSVGALPAVAGLWTAAGHVTGTSAGADLRAAVVVAGAVFAAGASVGADFWTAAGSAVNIRFNFITKGLVRDITSLNSKYFHVNVFGCDDFTFEGFKVSTPEGSLNTDGIHIGRSKGVTISNAKIGTGDDCISIGDGTENLKITKVACGPGHGINIGSLGKYENEDPASGITVSDCTLTGTTNGVRIKTWPAMFPNTATNIHFQDITMEKFSNPIIVDQMYCPWNKCNKKEPSKVKISDVSFKNIKGTSATALTVQLICSSGVPCEKVELANIDLTYSGPEGPAKSECIDVKPTIVGKIPERCK
ncbi:exopolygalacturonase-like [Manihot esculenta]|nr:exopolygalacturonase-like [Manihot esculenta]